MDIINYNLAEQLQIVDGYISEKNEKCANVLSVEMKNPDFDVEDYILQQNQVMNNLADMLKVHMNTYNDTLVNFKVTYAAFQRVIVANERLQALLKKDS